MSRRPPSSARPLPARTRVAVLVVVVVVVASGLAGCATGGDQDGGNGGLPDPTPSATEPGSTDTDTATSTATSTSTSTGIEVYVAMGDSYTAAPLSPLDDDVEIDDCLRSESNYPTIVADALGVTVDDVSCSGASTVSVFHTQQFTSVTQPPQIEALTPDVDLVTVGIGANDFTYFSEMIFDCLAVADRDVDGAPCREAHRNARGRDSLRRNLVAIRDNVARVVDAIGERAPDARILLVGYPQIIPTEGTCRRRLPLAVGDYAYTRDLNLRLARAVRDGGVSAGADYVNLVAASQGHDICADKPWIAGIRGKDNRAAGLHPYPAEQEAVADLVLDAL